MIRCFQQIENFDLLIWILPINEEFSNEEFSESWLLI